MAAAACAQPLRPQPNTQGGAALQSWHTRAGTGAGCGAGGSRTARRDRTHAPWVSTICRLDGSMARSTSSTVSKFASI